MNKLLIALFSIVIVLSGCATAVNTELFPIENGRYKAISTSSSETAALKDNLAKADEQCKKHGKSYVVISQNTRYSGVDKNFKKVAGLASDAAFFTSNTFIPTSALNSDDDYRVITLFRCK